MRESDKKKAELLGMNPATAAHRLRQNLLFDFVVKSGAKCFRCGEELTREDFSVEHKSSWVKSETPRESFFDLDNVAYSHLSCNCRAVHDEAFRGHPSWYQVKEHKCKCDECRNLVATTNAKRKRRQKSG